MTPARETAEQRLERLLHILPLAAREEGVTYEELSRTLGVDPGRVRRDVAELASRSFHHPPGSGDEIQVSLEGDRVRIWTTGEFRRPVALTPRELLALHLGLRVMAGQVRPDRRAGRGGERRPRVEALARDLATRLAAVDPDEVESLLGSPPVVTDVEQGPDEVRAAVFDAARRRLHCALSYLKPGDDAPEERRVQPWALVRAEGRWYVVGLGCEVGEVRVFRMDRILAARPDDEPFEVPDDFDAAGYVDGGKVYRAPEEERVRVRYSPRIARWIREREGEGEGAAAAAGEVAPGSAGEPAAGVEAVDEAPDGSALVYRRVADPRWLVRHVLQYGPDAEVVEPEEYRGMVREVVEGMAG